MGPSGSRKTICLIVYPVFFLLAVGACLLATAKEENSRTGRSDREADESDHDRRRALRSM